MSVKVSKIACDECNSTEWDTKGCSNCGAKMSDTKIRRELKDGYIKCKIDSCKIVKVAIDEGIGYPEIEEDKCLGYSNLNDDEPIEYCKNCKLHSTYEE